MFNSEGNYLLPLRLHDDKLILENFTNYVNCFDKLNINYTQVSKEIISIKWNKSNTMTYVCIIQWEETWQWQKEFKKKSKELCLGGHDNLYYIKDSKKKQVVTKEIWDLC